MLLLLLPASLLLMLLLPMLPSLMLPASLLLLLVLPASLPLSSALRPTYTARATMRAAPAGSCVVIAVSPPARVLMYWVCNTQVSVLAGASHA